ncbi:MAG TPA: hypothetical protein VFS08_20660 [Gemmatimonadaceae bacterium]|nr:hypothetical protein [Gemmatimonadaceae bacterium]
MTAEAPSPPTACPGSDFGTFLDAFAEDPTLQRRYTRLPLPVTTMDEGPDGPRPLERLLPADSIPWPVLLSAATRAAEGLELTIDSTAAGQWRVTAAKPDTDYQLEYTFMRDDERGACWYLVRYENASL